MSLKNYGPNGTNLIIAGIPIDEFGDSDPPITVEDIEQRSTLKRGIGGTSLRMDNATRPKRLTVNLMPGSDQVRQLLAVEKSGADITAVISISGSDEKTAMFDGVLTNRGQMGRAGKTQVSDEQLIFEFADSEET
jgi:hypothetical protein